MKRISLLVLAIFMFFTITSCGSNSNTDSNKTNPSTTDNQSVNTQDNDNGYLYEKNLNSAIKQEQNGNKISLAVENNKETIRVDELFSYSPEHLIEIYSSSNSAYNTTTKEMTLIVGFNNYQILFKNLKNNNEITYDLKIFRDPGTTTRNVTQYSVKKEILESLQNNGLPSYKFKFYYPYDENIALNGEAIPAEIIECNIEIQFSASFYIDSENFMPGAASPHQQMQSFNFTHKFTSAKEVYETTVDFPVEFWNSFCSSYPFTTLDNSQRGLYELNSNGLFVFTGSNVKLKVDYTKFNFN